MNNQSLIFLAIKSLDIQNQTSVTNSTFNPKFDTQLNKFILSSHIQSDKDLQNVILKILNSFNNKSLYDNNLAQGYKRRFRYYFKKMSFLKCLEKSIYNKNTLIDSFGITGLYLIYLISEKKGLFKLWLHYKNYNLQQLVKLIEVKNNLLV